MGWVQLVCLIMHDILIYSFHIYRWEKNIKKLDGWIRNFVWNGDVMTRKIYMVSWKRIVHIMRQVGWI